MGDFSRFVKRRLLTELSDESDFGRAIVADPDEATLWLVFADWLDEQDDPRGPVAREMGKVMTADEPGHFGAGRILQAGRQMVPQHDERRKLTLATFMSDQFDFYPQWWACTSRQLRQRLSPWYRYTPINAAGGRDHGRSLILAIDPLSADVRHAVLGISHPTRHPLRGEEFEAEMELIARDYEDNRRTADTVADGLPWKTGIA